MAIMAEPIGVVAALALLIVVYGVSRAATQGFFLTAFAALAAGAMSSLAAAALCHLLLLISYAPRDPNAGPLASSVHWAVSAMTSNPILQSLFLSLSQPSVGSMALSGILLLVAHFARILSRLSTDAEILFEHWAVFGHHNGGTDPAEQERGGTQKAETGRK